MRKLKKFRYLFIIIISIIFLNSTFSFAQESLDIAISSLTDQINKFMLEQKKTKIAIIPFPDLQKQTVTVLGTFIAEELTTTLFSSGNFKIVERNLLKQVLDELRLNQTGIMDAASAKELGKMTGVDAIVAGTIADLGSSIAINCRLIETESGEVFAAAKTRIRKDADIARIAEQAIDQPYLAKETKEQREQVDKKNTLIFDDKVFYMKTFDDTLCEVRLTSIRIMSDKTIECSLLYKNMSNDNIKVFLSGSQKPYLSDNLGNSYQLLSLKGLEEEDGILYSKGKEIPPGITSAVVYTFPKVQEKTEIISLIIPQGCFKSRHRQSYLTSIALGGNSRVFSNNVIFRDIDLGK